MAFKTPEQVAEEYLVNLKTLKPEVDTSQTDSDWVVRGKTVGGVISGAYADQRKIADDAFPQSARREALARHLDLYFGSGFRDATAAVGTVSVTGTVGTVYSVGTEFVYQPNGNSYQSTESLTLTGSTGEIPVQSVATGQSQNLLAGASLTLPSPPAGSSNLANALTNLSDGRNEETNEEASARILTRVRFPIAGGTETDYEQFAIDADPSVVTANVIRFPFGPGTVGVVFTAGTTDIDEAVDNGEPVIRVPSAELIETVRDYIESQNPLTDCLFLFEPVPITIDVTVKVRFVDGDLDTVPSGQTLTQRELVQREVERAIYKFPPGGRRFGASGFVVASEIEEVIDLGLSASPYTEGTYTQILRDRQVLDLSATGANRSILEVELATPGTIAVEEF